MLLQQATTGLAPMEKVERTEVVIVHPQQRVGFAQRNPYTMDVDRGRNYYACGGFGYMAWYCRKRETENRVAEGRRLEYRNNGQRRIEGRNEESDLNGKGNLIVFN